MKGQPQSSYKKFSAKLNEPIILHHWIYKRSLKETLAIL